MKSRYRRDLCALRLAVLLSVAVSLIVIAGCGSASTTTTAQPADTTSAVTTTETQPSSDTSPPEDQPAVSINWTVHVPESPSYDAEGIKWLVGEIEKRTEGRVTGEIFWGAVLGKPSDFPSMIGGKGVADGGWVLSSFAAGQLPLMNGASVAFLTDKDYRTQSKAYWNLLKVWQPLQEEITAANMKAIAPVPPSYMRWIFAKGSVADLKGANIAGPPVMKPILDHFGSKMVGIPSTEAYEALQKGVADGIVMPFHGGMLFKFDEVTDYMLDMEFTAGQANSLMMVNLDVWNSIGEADRETIMQLGDESGEYFFGLMEKERATVEEHYKTMGLRVERLTPEEEQAITAEAAPVVQEDWLAKLGDKRPLGEQFLAEYGAQVKEVAGK